MLQFPKLISAGILVAEAAIATTVLSVFVSTPATLFNPTAPTNHLAKSNQAKIAVQVVSIHFPELAIPQNLKSSTK